VADDGTLQGPDGMIDPGKAGHLWWRTSGYFGEAADFPILFAIVRFTDRILAAFTMALRASDQTRPESVDKRSLLRAHPFFKDLDEAVIDWLVPHAVSRKVKKGTVLFRKGDTGSKLYAVCAGAVRISAPSEQGSDAILNLITPGDIFGEIAFLDQGPRTADAVVVESGEVMVIERRDFILLLREHPEVFMRLIEILCSRLRRTSEQVEDIIFLGLPHRLAKVLLHLYRRSSTNEAPNKIRITQHEISQMIGASRESTNKQLRDWQRRKWLRLERNCVVVLAPEALTGFISESAG
jgi:CRP/FNR family transcriptional regulator, cyclic AMP receptor protein